MKRHLALFAILASAALTVAACKDDGPADQVKAQRTPVTAVNVAPVVRVARAPAIATTGVLVAKSEVKASFKVGGILAAIAVKDGALVKRGQVLATLTPTEIDAGVEQARQGVAKAERDLARAQELFAGKAATKEQLDDATTGAELARAQMRAVQFNKAHSVIRAPADGRVLRRLAEPGELVAPGQPIFLLAGAGAGLVLRVGLADRDVVRVAPNDMAQISLFAWPGRVQGGRVLEVASNATPPTGTFEVELGLDEPIAEAKVGMLASVTIAPTAAGEVALIPALALRDGDGKRATVWSLDGNADAEGAFAVKAHTVDVAFFDGDQAAISSGLEGASKVITDGAAYLHATSRAKPTTTTDHPTAAKGVP